MQTLCNCRGHVGPIFFVWEISPITNRTYYFRPTGLGRSFWMIFIVDIFIGLANHFLLLVRYLTKTNNKSLCLLVDNELFVFNKLRFIYFLNCRCGEMQFIEKLRVNIVVCFIKSDNSGDANHSTDTHSQLTITILMFGKQITELVTILNVTQLLVWYSIYNRIDINYRKLCIIKGMMIMSLERSEKLAFGFTIIRMDRSHGSEVTIKVMSNFAKKRLSIKILRHMLTRKKQHVWRYIPFVLIRKKTRTPCIFIIRSATFLPAWKSKYTSRHVDHSPGKMGAVTFALGYNTLRELFHIRDHTVKVAFSGNIVPGVRKILGFPGQGKSHFL